MTWFRLDDGWPFHPKTLAISDAAAGLLAKLGCYASGQLTDGFVPLSAIPRLSTSAGQERDALMGELLASGWLSEASKRGTKGVQIHDFLDYNPRRKEVKKLRAERSALGRKGGVASAQSRKQNGEPCGSSQAQAKVEPPSRPVPSRPAREDAIASSTDGEGAATLTLADRIDLRYRSEWESVPGHGMAHPAPQAAAKVAAWATTESLTLDDLVPVIKWLAAKGKGLGLLPSVYGEVKASQPKPDKFANTEFGERW